jgi:Flp pilus assembly protein TadD
LIMNRATLNRAASFLTDAQNRVTVIALMLIFMTLVAYYPVRNNGFVNYDDQAYVYNNHRVQKGLTAENVVWAFKTTDLTNWHPVTWLSHMLDAQLFGLRPAGHHATSFLLHLINVLLLFWLLYRMTGSTWRSALVAALFAVHPLNVESVAWVSERKNVLSATFWLLTIWAYVRYVRRPGWKPYLFVVGFFVVGLMTKPMLVTLPFVLLLLDFWPLGRMSGSGAAGRAARDGEAGGAEETRQEESGHAAPRPTLLKLGLEKLPLLALSVISSVITIKASAAGGAVVQTAGLSIGSRLSNTVVSYVAYLHDMVWPTRLAAFYPHPGANTPYTQLLLAGLLMVGITALIVWRVKSSRYLAVGWLWYLGTMLPVIGLIQVGGQARADRYTYIPMIGVFIIVAWGTAYCLRRLPRRNYWLGGVAACVLLALTLSTRQQVSYWQDGSSLWTHALLVTEDNYVAHTNVAIVLVAQGKYDEAIEQCNATLRLIPEHSLSYATMGEALVKKGQSDEGISYLYKALRLTVERDTAIAAQRALGDAMVKIGNDEKAVHHLSQALRLDSQLSDTHAKLGALLYKGGQFGRAIFHYSRAAQLSPVAGNYIQLASVLQEQGKLRESAVFYRKALNLEPDSPEAKRNLAMLGKFDLSAPAP